jgi:hypothetical protein
MSTDARCDRCGGNAVIRYVKIPSHDRDADGKDITPADWLNVIDCPKCGTIEQRRTDNSEQ